MGFRRQQSIIAFQALAAAGIGTAEYKRLSAEIEKAGIKPPMIRNKTGHKRHSMSQPKRRKLARRLGVF